MKREELMEIIGHVDEDLLLESERPVPTRKVSAWVKALVAAAVVSLMSVTAFAAVKLLSRPVESGGVVTEGTVSPVTFVQGDIYPEPQVGLKVVMEVQVDADAPQTLQEVYRLNLSAGWTENFRLGGGNGFEYNDYMTVWKKDGKAGEVRLRQTTATGYLLNTDGENVVDCLHELPLDTAVTAQVVTMADRQLLQVKIPPVTLEGFADPNVAYCTEGETRLYWTDGNYMFRMDYPAWVTGAEAEKMLQTLYSEAFSPQYPAGWGQLDVQKLKDYAFAENGGTTHFNISGNASGAAYRDGKLYLGESGAIRIVDVKSGETSLLPTWEDSLPRDLLLTESGICFADSRLPAWGRYHISYDGKTVDALYEGYQLADLWAAGQSLYGIDRDRNLLRIDLQTGAQEILARQVNKYYMTDESIYVLPENENRFLRAAADSMEFESFDLSFCPISMAADGNDLYFTVGGEVAAGQRRYQVVRYRQGEETKLPVCGTRLQIIGGKLLYDADPDNALIEMYDLENGQIDLLQKNVFDYFVFEDRYVVFSYYNNGWGILDWETGANTQIEKMDN